MEGQPLRTQNVPSDLPPARFRDPKERSRRDRLALIPNLDWRISDNVLLCQLERDLRVGLDIYPQLE